MNGLDREVSGRWRVCREVLGNCLGRIIDERGITQRRMEIEAMKGKAAVYQWRRWRRDGGLSSDVMEKVEIVRHSGSSARRRLHSSSSLRTHTIMILYSTFEQDETHAKSLQRFNRIVSALTARNKRRLSWSNAPIKKSQRIETALKLFP